MMMKVVMLMNAAVNATITVTNKRTDIKSRQKIDARDNNRRDLMTTATRPATATARATDPPRAS